MKSNKMLTRQEILAVTIESTQTKKLLIRAIISIGLIPGLSLSAQAQITTGGDGTLVNQTNGTFNITGGKPSASGTNLFHSFGKFDLNSGQTANFQPAANVQNILGRINSGLPSSINGTIKVSDSTANLYLMNPAGIVFGKGASLDVNGAFTATTANAIGFGDNKWFNAFGNNNYAALTGNPGDLAFTTAQPGSIFSAADLVTKPGKSITLVGGTVISTGKIVTQGGNITIATVPDGKSVRVSVDGSILALDLPTASSINPLPTNFKPTTLATLLTGGGIDLAANGVKIEGEIVRLFTDPNLKIAVGDTVTKANRQVSNGDVITANLDTSIPEPQRIFDPTNPNPLGSFNNPFTAKQPGPNGGDIRIESNNAILTGTIDTSNNLVNVRVRNEKGSGGNGGSIAMAARTEIKAGKIVSLTKNETSDRFLTDPNNPDSKERRPTDTEIATIQPRGGNVTLSTKTGDLIVDLIDAQASNGFVLETAYPNRGGDLTVKASGLFRIVKAGEIGINTSPFGIINISNGGKSFVVGTGRVPKENGTEGFESVPAPLGFTFPDGASGSLGSIVSSKFGNGSVATFYNGQNIAGITIGNPPVVTQPPVKNDPPVVTKPPRKDEAPDSEPKDNKDNTTKPKSEAQIAKKESDIKCDRTANSSATNQTTSTDETPNTSAADPCNQKANGTAILQILNSKQSK